MHSIRRIVIPGLLAGSLVASVAIVVSVGPASAGSGTSQKILTRLHLGTPQIANLLIDCEGDADSCKAEPHHQGTTVADLELLLQYVYQSSQVKTAPDVTTHSGKLTGLPVSPTTGKAHACEDKFGIAAFITGAVVETSSGAVKVNGAQHKKDSPTAASYSSPVASAEASRASGTIDGAGGTVFVRTLCLSQL